VQTAILAPGRENIVALPVVGNFNALGAVGELGIVEAVETAVPFPTPPVNVPNGASGGVN
jgi:hypothetical protein